RGDRLDRIPRVQAYILLRSSERAVHDQRRCRVLDPLVQGRRLVRDVQLEEVVPTVVRLRVERVDVSTVGEGEPLLIGAGEMRDELGAVPAGLLVFELTRHERRDVDL